MVGALAQYSWSLSLKSRVHLLRDSCMDFVLMKNLTQSSLFVGIQLMTLSKDELALESNTLHHTRHDGLYFFNDLYA